MLVFDGFHVGNGPFMADFCVSDAAGFVFVKIFTSWTPLHLDDLSCVVHAYTVR